MPVGLVYDFNGEGLFTGPESSVPIDYAKLQPILPGHPRRNSVIIPSPIHLVHIKCYNTKTIAQGCLQPITPHSLLPREQPLARNKRSAHFEHVHRFPLRHLTLLSRQTSFIMENFYKDELVFSESARSMEGGWVGFRAVHPPSSGVCTSAGRVDGPDGSRNFL
ncbi:hypothetical protein Zmor_025908 [Zophobas morio]|uniref:Uncharacterized protein n=1 Tax=Zophobas morio TaxID=2755281 RepID=A0AA38HSN2_9CUCU|nr:hypothetical protein Zmor_025908 [Zophobas morio]